MHDDQWLNDLKNRFKDYRENPDDETQVRLFDRLSETKTEDTVRWGTRVLSSLLSASIIFLVGLHRITPTVYSTKDKTTLQYSLINRKDASSFFTELNVSFGSLKTEKQIDGLEESIIQPVVGSSIDQKKHTTFFDRNQMQNTATNESLKTKKQINGVTRNLIQSTFGLGLAQKNDSSISSKKQNIDANEFLKGEEKVIGMAKKIIQLPVRSNIARKNEDSTFDKNQVQNIGASELLKTAVKINSISKSIIQGTIKSPAAQKNDSTTLVKDQSHKHRETEKEAFAFSFSEREAKLDSTEAQVHKMNTSTLKNDSSDEKRISAKSKRIRKLSVYFSIAPMLNFFSVKPNLADSYVITDISKKPIFDRNRIGTALQVGLQFPIAKHLQVQGGLSYFAQDARISYHYYDPSDLVIKPSGFNNNEYWVQPSDSDHQFNYSMANIGLQAGMFYFLDHEKFYRKIGFELNYSKGLLQSLPGSSYSNKGSTYLFLHVLLQAGYRVTDNFEVYIQPIYAQSIIANEPRNEWLRIEPRRVGLGFGVAYSFHRGGK